VHPVGSYFPNVSQCMVHKTLNLVWQHYANLCSAIFFFYCVHWVILRYTVFKGLNILLFVLSLAYICNRAEFVEYVYDTREDATWFGTFCFSGHYPIVIRLSVLILLQVLLFVMSYSHFWYFQIVCPALGSFFQWSGLPSCHIFSCWQMIKADIYY